MTTRYVYGADEQPLAPVELDPAVADLARRVQQAAREIEQREMDDETAVRYARHVEGTW